MPAIADIIIKSPAKKVWSVIADATTHIHWLGRGEITTYDGELTEGMKFKRSKSGSDSSVEGEVIAVRPEQFLKVRVDVGPDIFVTTEYHLLAVDHKCVVRVLFEAYDTAESQHTYFPEVMEQEWQANLERLRSYCEAV
ncbi:MAG: SRPBCC domain-containing protein [Verrucomicrobiota bacterium]